jgi:hypothetical protein
LAQHLLEILTAEMTALIEKDNLATGRRRGFCGRQPSGAATDDQYFRAIYLAGRTGWNRMLRRGRWKGKRRPPASPYDHSVADREHAGTEIFLAVDLYDAF